ncbi:unnamed protein product [Effrenium voratum]|nr:unnamed protein product [Effrenium voratum]
MRCLVVARLLGALAGSLKPSPVGTSSGAATAAPQEFWTWLMEVGVLNESYVSWINCQGHPWDRFRALLVSHLEEGGWNYGEPEAWVSAPGHWTLIKEAEMIVELWRQRDLKIQVENISLAEHMAMPKRAATRAPSGVVRGDTVAWIIADHLHHMKNPGLRSESFAGSCLQGVLAALGVFARALHVLGKSEIWTAGSEDGFLLWRVEMGFLVAGMLLGEGLSLFDLTAAPGWPGLNTRFFEQLLHQPAEGDGGELNLPKETAVLGLPRRVGDPIPEKMPTAERYHAATDPAGATSWGKSLAAQMAARGQVLRLATEVLPPGHPFPWKELGLPYRVPDREQARRLFLPGWRRKIRMLAILAYHGALDLEIPELLLHLFARWFHARFVLSGANTQHICRNTEGSRTLATLCPERPEARHFKRPFEGPSWKRKWGRAKMSGKRRHLFEGRGTIHPNDPRLQFRSRSAAKNPDLITVSGWIDAIHLTQRFPGVPLVMYFGPPVMLVVAEDVLEGNRALVDVFWQRVRGLTKKAVLGQMFIAAESLFRAEQFFWQTGVEVPFLRPMSTWVNASYTPKNRRHAGAEVLVHNRGRLKYETAFLESLQLMAGINFPYTIVPQGGRIIPFREMASFHAVVIVPWSPELCMLRHLFKMWMPLLVPEPSLLRNLVHVANMRLLPYPYNAFDPHSNRAYVESIHPFDPFLDTAKPPADVRGVKARAYWAEYSEYLLLPELLRFASSADLLARLNAMEGHKVSQRMRAAYRNDMQEMMSFWQELLPVMLTKRQVWTDGFKLFAFASAHESIEGCVI